METSVSVVIPAYDRAHTIERALSSVRRQSHSPLEILVVDDASSDTTREVVGRIDDSRIRVLGLERNHGPAGARNAGVAAAKGRWIAFLDSDDEWAETKLEK